MNKGGTPGADFMTNSLNGRPVVKTMDSNYYIYYYSIT